MKWLYCLVILVCASCATQQMSIPSLDTVNAPPGTIEISENNYFDKSEISNFSYLEYLFWLSNNYGSNSQAYIEMLPDTNCWLKIDSTSLNLRDFYLRHPAYRDYPVVGVSYQQATAFTNWRSDRVMEYLLVAYDIIEFKPKPPVDSLFTIEKYFTGNYYGMKPMVDFYPSYSLPDSAMYRNVIPFADSLNARNSRYCKKNSCTDNFYLDCNCRNLANDDSLLTRNTDFTMSVDCYACRKALITHLKGNLQEFIREEGLAFGLSFMDLNSTSYAVFRTINDSTNAFTGFRNSCSYKKWGVE